MYDIIYLMNHKERKMIKMYIFKLYNNDQLIELIDAAPDESKKIFQKLGVSCGRKCFGREAIVC